MTSKLLISAAALTAAFATSAASAATTLSGTGLASNLDIEPSYGSNLAGTPNVSLHWSPVSFAVPNDSGNDGWQTYADPGNPNPWTTTSGINTTGTGVYQMGMGTVGTDYHILFSPDDGYAVVLNSVDIDIYTGGGSWAMTATIFDSTGTISFASFPLTPSAGDPDGNSTWSLGDYTGGIGESLLLRFEIQSAGTSGGYIAMDNLTFDQVPEPSAALLGGFGALALLRRRRR